MKNKRESGQVVVEASIIVSLVMIFITVLLYIGMVLYQKTLVSVMANQTASNIAQVYSNNLKDPFTGYVDPDRAYQSVTYSNMKTDAYMDVIEQKANIFAQYRLKSSRILATGNSAVEVDIVKKPNELLKSQVVVTIKDRFDVPLAGFFGANGIMEFSASGRADCVDILEYINGVEAIGDPEGSSIQFIPNAESCLVTFVSDESSGKIHSLVPVMKGKSILSSTYTHSKMPSAPQSNQFTFLGWKKSDGSAFTANEQIEQDITVYARWQCKVKFSPEGGTMSITEKGVELGKCVEFPGVSRAGYTFGGWFTEKKGKGTQYYSNTSEINGNIVLYANWICLHKDGNGVSKMVFAEKKIYTCAEVSGAKKSYELYRCSDCGHEMKKTIDNKHYILEDYIINETEFIKRSATENYFITRCNVNHLSAPTTGPNGSYENGFNNGKVSVKHHITCCYCGMHAPPVWWDNITNVHEYKEVFWVSSWRSTTQCKTPSVRY